MAEVVAWSVFLDPVRKLTEMSGHKKSINRRG
jgi:hypothetical protein